MNKKITMMDVKMMCRSLLVMSILFLSSAAMAQYKVDEQSAGWYMYFGNHRITDKIGIHTEYQWRRADLIDYWQQSLMRIGLDYYSKSGAVWTGGYGWIVTFPYGKQPIAYPFNEHRIWQQLVLNQEAGRFDLNHRFRLEQRFLEKKELNDEGDYQTDEYIFRQRARYRFYAALPLNHKEMVDNTLFLGMYDEVMIGFGGGLGINILQQNRLYVALGWRFNPRCNIQVGYLNQTVFKPNAMMELNNTLQVGLTYNIDFRKKD